MWERKVGAKGRGRGAKNNSGGRCWREVKKHTEEKEERKM